MCLSTRSWRIRLRLHNGRSGLRSSTTLRVPTILFTSSINVEGGLSAVRPTSLLLFARLTSSDATVTFIIFRQQAHHRPIRGLKNNKRRGRGKQKNVAGTSTHTGQRTCVTCMLTCKHTPPHPQHTNHDQDGFSLHNLTEDGGRDRTRHRIWPAAAAPMGGWTDDLEVFFHRGFVLHAPQSSVVHGREAPCLMRFMVKGY